MNIQSCHFIICIGDTNLYVVILNDNYRIISYFFQILRKFFQDYFNTTDLNFNICINKQTYNSYELFRNIQEGNGEIQQIANCFTTFFYGGIIEGKMELKLGGKRKFVDIDSINVISNYKELFPSGKVLYLITKNKMKVPVSKKEDFFEDWEALNDLAEPCTEEGKIIDSDMKLIFIDLMIFIPKKYTHYMFGDYREEFTEFKNDFNCIDLIKY